MKRDVRRILLVQAGPNSRDYLFRSHPLGLMSLAAYVERELPGVEVDVLDLKVAAERVEDLGRIAEERGAGVVGIGAMSLHADMQLRAAEAVRAALPDAMIVGGGPHATCFPDRLLGNGCFDAVVQGEGEKPLVNLIGARLEGRPPDGIPAVATPRDRSPGTRDIVDDLDTLPFPAWRKIDLEAYRRHSSFCLLGRRNYMSIFTSRACPYGCFYCHNIFGNRFRARSAGSVLEEIRTLARDHGITDFDVLDDVFNLRRERVEEICRALIADGPKVTLAFPNGLRSDLLDDDLLALMREAGTIYISFAIETASPRLQKLIHKNLDIEKAARAIRAATKLGIFSNGFFMVGFPTETEPELRSTIRFAIKSPLDTAHFLKVTPFEGTRLYDMLDADTRRLVSGSPDRFRYEDRTYNLSEVPNRRFKRIVHGAFFRFFVNPARVYNIFRRHPWPANLFMFARTAFTRIFIKG